MNPISKALEHLPGNWTKGGIDEHGNTCGLGHVYSFGMEDSIDFSQFRQARDLMEEMARAEYPERVADLSPTYLAFAAFNDHPDTTEAQVIAVMEKAATKYDELYG